MRISDWSSDVCSSDLQYVARLGQPEIDRGLGDSELPRDLLRGLSLDQEIETGPLLVGEARPAFGVLKCVRPRITHVHTLVKIASGTSPGGDSRGRGRSLDRKSTRLNSSHSCAPRMTSSA